MSLFRKNIKVLCLGDCMLDHWAFGLVNRISPEAPVPVFREKSQLYMLGGAANVAANLISLGAESVELIGLRGPDDDGELLKGLLNDGEIVDRCVISPTRKTTRKLRFVARQQQLLRVDQESPGVLTEAEEEQMLQRVEDYMINDGIVVVSDYAKGVVTRDVCFNTSTRARRNNNFVIVDPKVEFSKYANANLLTPNRKELTVACSEGFSNPKALIEMLGLDAVIVKANADGLYLHEKSNFNPKHFPSITSEVTNVCGAGDVVVAALALSIGSGKSLSDATKIAVVAGSLAVLKGMTSVVFQNELEEALEHQRFKPVG